MIDHDVDAAVIAAGKESDIPTIIVCPPTIRGVRKWPRWETQYSDSLLQKTR